MISVKDAVDRRCGGGGAVLCGVVWCVRCDHESAKKSTLRDRPSAGLRGRGPAFRPCGAFDPLGSLSRCAV